MKNNEIILKIMKKIKDNYNQIGFLEKNDYRTSSKRIIIVYYV